jgi:hypothetical protein
MSKFIMLILLLVVSVAVRAEQPLLPSTFFDLRGPCFAPDKIEASMRADKFHLVAVGRAIVSTELIAQVHFYRRGDDFIIAMKHDNMICTVIVGENLNFGV